jgi:hypothetical protein
MKTIAWLAGIGTLLAAGAYMLVSLNRWEWNRALFFGLIVLIAEVGLATGLVLRRLARLEHAQHTVVDPAVMEILQATRPAHPDRFAWLKESTSGTTTNVFITFLVGGGVLLSGIAWIVERIARATVTPVAERGLAAQLDGLALPVHGFVTAERSPADLLRGPVGRQR